jgi:WhiB family redox-sensing transcriptional regulator
MIIRYLHLLERAACADCPPEWFDAVTHDDAETGLRVCSVCPVQDLCLEILNPQRTFMDGVCGGRVFRNGLRVLPDGREVGPRSKHQDEQLALGSSYGVSEIHGD